MVPEILARHLRSKLAINILSQTHLSDGAFNQAAHLQTDRGDLFLKWNPNHLPNLFALEAQGLDLIRSTQSVHVPDVYDYQEASADGRPAYLLLEWINQIRFTVAGMQELGQNLAALHRTAPTRPNFGLDQDNYIGSSSQSNLWGQDWLAFFRDHRLGFQIQLAAGRGLLPSTRHKRLDTLLGQLGRWILADNLSPSLVHGDLWGGNILQSPIDGPVLIDPAVYFGDREVDIAFSELFGGFSNVFYSAYQEAWPLNPGYKERRDLYNLYHLLNHLNLFGESYGKAIDAILVHYTG